jgi:hypothetical protein
MGKRVEMLHFYKRKNKKGELSTQQIVVIIILITSFVVLLYFLFRLNPAKSSAEEVCHNSVVLASKGSGLVGGLDCKTNYLCISGGGECTGFSPTETAKVDSSKKEEALKAIADQMATCWWMFGEGQREYLSANVLEEAGDALFGSSTPYHCAICSKVRLDSSMPDVSYSELYNYLATNKTSRSPTQTYLQYLYGVSSLDSLKTAFQLKAASFSSGGISPGTDYAIITGINPQLIHSDEYLKVYLLNSDDLASKSMCGKFDITQA